MRLVKSYGRFKFFLKNDLLVFQEFIAVIKTSLLCEVPGGNLVDGLPPAASTGEDDIAPATHPWCEALSFDFSSFWWSNCILRGEYGQKQVSDKRVVFDKFLNFFM